MAKYPRHRCKDCGTTDEQTPISRNGLCGDCATNRQRVNALLARRVRYEIARDTIALAQIDRQIGGRPITPHAPDA